MAIDVSGLLQLGWAQNMLQSFLLEQVLGRADDADEKKDGEAKRPKGKTANDMHIGGALAGVLWHAAPTLWGKLGEVSNAKVVPTRGHCRVPPRPRDVL